MPIDTLTNIAEFTVSELSAAIKRTVEDAFGYVRLRGEISGYRGPHSSGHVYFSLKDERAKIDGVIWKGVFSNLKFKPEEGLEVIVTGRVTTFPGKSSYQIIIDQLEPAGAGALMALLEERKKRLAAEGLFADERKKPRPFWPTCVGIVTSPTGAVIRDMLHGFAERCPTHVIVWPVRVQGETCAAEVAAAVAGFNALGAGGPVPRPDLLIVARGGGSLEDLWGFNEEIVVRAVAASQIPVIAAVGHETDWTLIDLVADARAPTPTKAAEWAVPKHSELCLKLADLSTRARRSMIRHLEKARSDFRGLERALPKGTALLAVPCQRLDSATMRLSQALRHFAHEARSRLERCAVRLKPRLVRQYIDRAKERFVRAALANTKAFERGVALKRMGLVAIAARLDPKQLPPLIQRHKDRLVACERHLNQALRHFSSRSRGRLSQTAARLSARLVGERVARAREQFHRAGLLLRGNLTRNLTAMRTRYHDRARRLDVALLKAPVERRRLFFEAMAARLAPAQRNLIARRKERLGALSQLLRSLSHRSVLERGFALVRHASGGMVRRAAMVDPAGEALDIEFADGRIKARATKLAEGAGEDGARPKTGAQSPRAKVQKDKDAQGSLL